MMMYFLTLRMIIHHGGGFNVIIIKMYQGKWIIQIGDEKWEFKNKEEMMDVLGKLIEFKDKFGRIGYEK